MGSSVVDGMKVDVQRYEEYGSKPRILYIMESDSSPSALHVILCR